MSDSSNEYVLGTNDAELVRLGIQHRLWSSQAFAAWLRAGIGPGARVLDVGCGPGHATFDLAQLVTNAGRVVAVDESERFIRYLSAQAEVRGVVNVETHVQDVQALDIPPACVDFAWARWLLCFTPRPGDVVAGVAAALEPGGLFVVHDYTYWQGMFLTPPSESFLEVLRATDRAWRDAGGDSEVGRRLPALFAAHGLEVESIRPLQRVARPHEPLWQWPGTFFANWAPALVQRGYLRPEVAAAFAADWAARSGDRTTFLWTPPMVEIIGRRS